MSALRRFITFVCLGAITGLSPASADIQLADATADAHITFKHANGARGDLQMPETIGSGGGFLDFDGDGNLDLYVPSYYGAPPGLVFLAASYCGEASTWELPHLYRGDGLGGFRDVAGESGLKRLVLPMGSNFGDVDNDGYLDFYLGTGYPDSSGLGHLQKGHGIGFADLDHDGDQDIFAQMGGALRGDKFFDALFRNPGFGNHWLTIKLVGVRTNRAAIGARIRVELQENGKRRVVFKHVNSGGSFGASPLRQTIGLGRATKIERLEIYWPTSDHTQEFHDVEMDQFVRAVEFEKTLEILQLDSFDLAPKAR